MPYQPRVTGAPSIKVSLAAQTVNNNADTALVFDTLVSGNAAFIHDDVAGTVQVVDAGLVWLQAELYWATINEDTTIRVSYKINAGAFNYFVIQPLIVPHTYALDVTDIVVTPIPVDFRQSVVLGAFEVGAGDEITIGVAPTSLGAQGTFDFGTSYLAVTKTS